MGTSMIPDVSWTWNGFFQLVGVLFCVGITLAVAFWVITVWFTFIWPNISNAAKFGRILLGLPALLALVYELRA